MLNIEFNISNFFINIKYIKIRWKNSKFKSLEMTILERES